MRDQRGERTVGVGRRYAQDQRWTYLGRHAEIYQPHFASTWRCHCPSRRSSSTIVREAKRHDGDAFHRLRFDRVQEFASYARLVKCPKQSGGRTLGTSGAKRGNGHLKWAFSEAAVLVLRHTKDGKKLLTAMAKKHGKGKALSILAHKIGRAVYYMLSRSPMHAGHRRRKTPTSPLTSTVTAPTDLR